jgi:hypothetical protein
MLAPRSIRIVVAISGAALGLTGCSVAVARRVAGSDISLPQSTTARLVQQLTAPCESNVPTTTTPTEKGSACAQVPSYTTDRHAGPETTQKRP